MDADSQLRLCGERCRPSLPRRSLGNVDGGCWGGSSEIWDLGRAEGGSGPWWWGGAGNTLLRALRTGRGGKRWRWGAGNERGVKGAVRGSVQRNGATAFISRCPTHLSAGFWLSLSQKPKPGVFCPAWGPAGLPRCPKTPQKRPLVPKHPKRCCLPWLSGIPQVEPAPERGKTPKRPQGKSHGGDLGLGGALLGAWQCLTAPCSPVALRSVSFLPPEVNPAARGGKKIKNK